MKLSPRQAQAEVTQEAVRAEGHRTAEDDPELMEILRRFIFGDVLATGVLDDKTRELITVTGPGCLQTLPRLRSHTRAALNVGVQPAQIRERSISWLSFIGFPRTLNAVATIINEVFRRRHPPPLQDHDTVSDDERYSCLQVGNSKTAVVAALVHCFP